ncbi:MAG: uracil-DNA glycosylase [Gemmatimonadales bacterium]|nr:uracil-DNA glycosylase [Gemmatimonadales bacterium]
MVDARKYLELQKALGGNEVILSAPLGESSRGRDSGRGDLGEIASGPVAPRNDPIPTAPRNDGGSLRGGEAAEAVSPPGSKKGPKHWTDDAPPIPTAHGIQVERKESGLLEAPSPWNSLDEVAAAIASCTKCFLCEGRTKTVPGEGNPSARLMFVGEGPGQTEDETGRPFVGRAGELLTQIIESVELRREQVFIANAVKCRPPQNRKPLPDEIATCRPYLDRQIDLVAPKVLVALGATAAETLLKVKRSLADLRERVHSFHGIPLVVTYHPAALLRNPNWKKPTWDDIRIARQLLDR